MRWLAFVFTLLISALGATAQIPTAQVLFERALANRSTSPNYVLVTVVNGNSQQTRGLCVPAPELIAALSVEYDLNYEQSLAFARKLGQDRTFTMSDPAAIARLPLMYSQADVETVRALLFPYSHAELTEAFRVGSKSPILEQIQAYYDPMKPSPKKDVVAHALLERGLLPKRSCVTGQIFVE